MNDISIPTRTMTSREIAELTGKQHKNVVRDIRNMVEQIPAGSDLSWLCESTTYTDAQGKERTQYILDYDATMTLVTGYNVELRLRIVRRWRELETGAAPVAQVAPPVSLLEEQERRITMSERMIDIAERIGDDLLMTLAGDNIKNAFGALLLRHDGKQNTGLFQIHEVLEELGMPPAEIRARGATIGKRVGTWYRAQGKSASKTQRYIEGARRTVNAYPAADRSAVADFIRTLI
jgi:Rha family phage regulatory protein